MMREKKNSDIGLDLLVNQAKKKRTSENTRLEINLDNINAVPQQPQFNTSDNDIDIEGLGGMPNIDIGGIGGRNDETNIPNIKPLKDIRFEATAEPSIDITTEHQNTGSPENNSMDYPHIVEKNTIFTRPPSANTSRVSPQPPPVYEYAPPQKSADELLNEKYELLYKFDNLKNKGVKITRNFNIHSDIEEMRYEYNRILKDREKLNGVKFARKMLMAFTTGVEFLNAKVDPFDLKLDGWSESIHENINDYDDVFEELAEKYKSTAKMSPELKLLFMVGGSAFMFHLTNTMLKSSLPGMGDIMKQNPDLMKQFASAAMKSVSQNSPGAANFMNTVSPQTTRQPRQMPTHVNIPRTSEQMHSPRPQFFNIGTRNQGGQVREMRPPIGVDDIINELDVDSKNIDLDSISSNRSVSSRIRQKTKSGGISLDLS